MLLFAVATYVNTSSRNFLFFLIQEKKKTLINFVEVHRFLSSLKTKPRVIKLDSIYTN